MNPNAPQVFLLGDRVVNALAEGPVGFSYLLLSTLELSDAQSL